MAHHESVICPRCKAAFECRVGSILQCQCQQVTLTEDERAYINETYSECLCASCLTAMQKSYRQTHFLKRLQQFFSLSSKR
ncbi:cysteine-rich CWC family protein [Chitinophaga sp. CF118]|uniref:cysteine-rich CWC family protein n=1 Tax=Chitinophaga sp. CF118 TaxID=1884367 RepID=UPI000B7C6111|nr:cysteine-rich CWC family protein [Chitinophaga sp. CF118]